MTDELDWPLEGSESRGRLPLFGVRFDHRRHPQTGEVLERLVLESVDWVNVLALDTEGRVIMIRQFRFGAGYTTLEVPGGMVDAGETPLEAARRELEEETGCTGGTWHYLGNVEPNPAIHDNLCHHYLARDVSATRPQDLSAGEAIRVELMSPDDVIEAARSGEIRHALVLSTLSRVFDLWPRPFIQDDTGQWPDEVSKT